MIATAISKPMANALPMAKVNAESGFTSGCRLSSDMLLTPPIGESKSCYQGRGGRGFLTRALCSEAPGAKGCLKMVNKVLMVGSWDDKLTCLSCPIPFSTARRPDA